jgi:hypothetical protein
MLGIIWIHENLLFFVTKNGADFVSEKVLKKILSLAGAYKIEKTPSKTKINLQ